MNTLKRLCVTMLTVAVLLMGSTGCQSNHEHPTGDHPAGEHPAKTPSSAGTTEKAPADQ